MARARKSSGGGKAKAAKPARSAKKAPKAEVKMVDEDGIEVVKKGLSIDEGILIGTFIVTVGAWVMMMMAGQNYVETGM